MKYIVRQLLLLLGTDKQVFGEPTLGQTCEKND